MMPQTRVRPPSRAQMELNARRSVSGGSTASHESGPTLESNFDTERKYAPLRDLRPPYAPTAYPAQQMHDGLPFSQQHPVIEQMAIDQINQFNSSQSQRSMVDPPMHGFQDQRHYLSHHGLQQENNFVPLHNGSTAGPFHPAQDVRATGTPFDGLQLGIPAPTTGTDVEKKDKKSATATAANEKELRELLEKNQHRTLDSIAKDVRNAERTQKSEKAKQLFAMRWLREYCRQDKESVPRNRVYTHYAQRCGTDRVDTLNPASFGKLVRVIFPGIQTRRLGVRGESKYHYVNLMLVEDPQAGGGRAPSRQASVAIDDRGTSYVPEIEPPVMSRAPTDTAPFPSRQETYQPIQLPLPPPVSNPRSQGRLFAAPNVIGIGNQGEGPQMYTQTLRFTSDLDSSLQSPTMLLPVIHEYVPARTDIDLADALTALYRTHCTSLVDAVRYVKEKQFAKLLRSFNGTMTVPVSRLFQHPALAPWIKACDELMYQQIVRFVSQLALQVIPPQVFMMLDNISKGLTQQIRTNFQHFPEHVMQAKLEPATIFCSLLQRLLRVNETAHAAANLLINDQMRNAMWQDWVKNVRPKRVVETELPECGHEEVYYILTRQVRQLLEPLEPSDWLDAGTDFATTPFSPNNGGIPHGGFHTAEGILDRWAVFLKLLPSRFPKASTRTLLQCISTVGTATLRDLTVNQAQSFGGWWITKVWVDEMMLWLAESGGFLEDKNAARATSTPHTDGFESFLETTAGPGEDHGNNDGTSGLGLDFHQMPSFEPNHGGPKSIGPPTANFKFTTRLDTNPVASSFEFHDENDDSGIGMSILSSNMDHKFDFGTGHMTTNGHELLV